MGCFKEIDILLNEDELNVDLELDALDLQLLLLDEEVDAIMRSAEEYVSKAQEAISNSYRGLDYFSF